MIHALFAELYFSYCIFQRYDMIYNKGYQVKDVGSSSITTKVKGLGYINYPNNSMKNLTGFNNAYIVNDQMPIHVFDTPDYVVPPNEYNSIFIMTNFIKTIQSQGLCQEVNIQKTKHA